LGGVAATLMSKMRERQRESREKREREGEPKAGLNRSVDRTP
jgi:hypothetical protein